MAAGEKPYTLYRGGRQKGTVPLQRRVEPPRHPPHGPKRPSLKQRPGRPRRARRWGWKRWTALTVLGLVVLLVVWSVAGYLSVRSGVQAAERRLRQTAPGAAAVLTKQNGLLLSNASNILLLGTDHSQLASRAGDRHSDSMMLLHVDGSRHRIAYLSIPRDLYVPIPGYGDNKINAAMQIGGAPLAIKTVAQFTGLPINHVVLVDFNSFVSLIDKVGGVDINVPEKILSDKFDCPYTAARCASWPGWRFQKGMQHMDGHRALIYSRIRVNQLNPAESDVTRGERQQQVIQALLAKLASIGTFFRLPFVGGDLLKPITTDLSTNQFLQLAWIKFRAGSVIHCRLGGDPTNGSYLQPSENNVQVIQMVLGNTAVQLPRPGSGPYGPGCISGHQTFIP